MDTYFVKDKNLAVIKQQEQVSLTKIEMIFE